jgi:cobalt-precorrin-5B (C1)-methyltransferase
MQTTSNIFSAHDTRTGRDNGRARCCKTLDEAGSSYYYSTKSNLQQVEMANDIRLTGVMNREGMTAFCREKAIRLLIDAAHPFAAILHATLEEVSSELGIPVIRYERTFPPRDEQFIWCKDYADAIRLLTSHHVKRLLALTGVNTIAPLRPYWEKHDCLFRILDREESRTIVREQGFPPGNIFYYEEENDAGKEAALIRSLRPDAVMTKESGHAGNFPAKAEAARQAGIPLFVIQRPGMPGAFQTVHGEAGLRRQIDRLLPGFFPLRTGYSTGACATAAVKAALLALLAGTREQVEISLPSGEPVTFPIAATEVGADYARCTVVKDAGDDPDVTPLQLL